MLSIAFASPIRRLLLLMMGVICTFALQSQAQTVPDPCGTAPAFEAAAISNSQRSVQLAYYLCGGAGQRCCPWNTCNAGLACNANGICRTCGGSGDICCSGNTCSAGLTCTGGRCTAPPPPPCGGLYQACCSGVCYGGDLVCSFGTNTCIPCGRLFEACCEGNRCAAGTCSGSTCQ